MERQKRVRKPKISALLEEQFCNVLLVMFIGRNLQNTYAISVYFGKKKTVVPLQSTGYE